MVPNCPRSTDRVEELRLVKMFIRLSIGQLGKFGPEYVHVTELSAFGWNCCKSTALIDLSEII